MKVVIVGANFDNKGAQSMLFTTVATLRRSYPDVEIFFAHPNLMPCLDENFLFEEIYYDHSLIKVSSDTIDITKSKDIRWGSMQESFRIMQQADLFLDVSGFGLGSNWGANHSLAYLNHVKLARALEVPIILMPQSFGPFDFGKYQATMDAEIRTTLTYPEKIFARERDGYVSLRGKYQLQNVTLHPDLVLSIQQLKFSDIYKNPPPISVPKVLEASCVGILPNLRSFDYANPWQTLQAYYEIIKFLLKSGKIVYLFCHSVEDIMPCSWLKSLFAEDGRVVLWKNNFSCFDYDVACKQFDFLIVGRFHGIVHAYRNNVPCLLMGWAVKYRELAQLMYQSRYIFDLAAPELDMREIFSAIRDMEENLSANKKILRERLTQVQESSSCFDAAIKILGRRS